MKINDAAIKKLLAVLDFSPDSGAVNRWVKYYFKNYHITIDFSRKHINFGDKIKVYNKAANNFDRAENFVVLECVDRLLIKGYQPENIFLEKAWRLGHRDKGYLDILLAYPKPNEDKTFLMIECKTSGKEFKKAVDRILIGKEQLFSYYQQDKSAAALCLYTSCAKDGNIELDYKIIRPTVNMQKAATAEEVFSLWNKKLESKGYFGLEDKLYDINDNVFNYKSLRDMKEEDSGYIFHQFAKILRHHAVSDKPNAFNKMFTLFLCKIMDEKLGDDDHQAKLKFQWLSDDDDIKLQSRLNDLYKKGMWQFLEKEIADVNDEDIDNIFRDVAETTLQNKLKKRMQEKMIELRFYKNNEFSFKEVFDKNTFEENAKVVREVVNLLSHYKLRYNHKQKFLSDFFELLLQTGLKQEAGQFFTPVPIAKFILMSLPIEQIIQHKIDNGEQENFLPYIIDYAAGSGHFLTESMDRVHKIIEKMAAQPQKKSISSELQHYLNRAYDWAMQFIYGIEKDYRLVKTAKVSCFMYGDGLANVTLDDGLACFNEYPENKPLLRHTDKYNSQDNKNFDILAANPPYSVSGFRETIKKSKDSFSLFPLLTPESNEIECLFIERAKQLLKEGAIAAIILPSSILSNGGIHEAARRLLLRHFSIIAIVELGAGTFMATGTNTVILFLRRISDHQDSHIQSVIKKFCVQPEDFTCNGAENAFSLFVSHSYPEIAFKDYVSLFQKKPTKKMQEYFLYQDYVKQHTKINKNKKIKIDLYIYIIHCESEKLQYFMHVARSKILLIKSGEKSIEKQFLGYEFSNRRGYEGMTMHTDADGKLLTKLYDEDNLLNPEKVNAHIYHAFLGADKMLDVSESLSQHIEWADMKDLINFSNIDFNVGVSTKIKKKILKNNKKSRWEMVRLGEITKIFNGGTPAKKAREYWGGTIPWATLADTKQKYIIVTKRRITEAGLHNSNTTLLPVNTILFSSRATIGEVAIAKVEMCTNQGYKNFVCDKDKLHYEFLYYALKGLKLELIMLAGGMTYKEINTTQMKNFKIPLPPLNIQQKIVDEMLAIEKHEKESKEKIAVLRMKVKNTIKKMFEGVQTVRFGDVLKLEYGKPLPETARVKGDFPVMGSNGIIGYHNEFFVEAPAIIIGRKGSTGKVNLAEKNCYPIDTAFYVNFDESQWYYKVLYYLLEDLELEKLRSGLGSGGINRNRIYELKIPYPSLIIQNKLARLILKIEEKMDALEQDIVQLQEQKASVLSGYLYEP